ncbi:hypothetical protein D0859_16240 [Hortaea werneckii]|uniref:Uncharacterized protein n=1 Tax=Hortaea werneckii TaxID=91943 RepID=A0A3M7I2I9_HORWE|nr:hypothetical protein D0859_16240 [Hortaea werneckii]
MYIQRRRRAFCLMSAARRLVCGVRQRRALARKATAAARFWKWSSTSRAWKGDDTISLTTRTEAARSSVSTVKTWGTVLRTRVQNSSAAKAFLALKAHASSTASRQSGREILTISDCSDRLRQAR